MEKLIALTINGETIQGAGGVPQGGIVKLYEVLSVIIALLILASVILCLFYIIWGGFFWITSEGDKQKLNQARQRIVFAIIGLMVVFLAYAIISVVTNFFFGPSTNYCLIMPGVRVPC